MKALLLATGLLAPWVQWKYVPWPTLIARAKIVVTGEVTDFGADGEGRKTARLQVHEVLRGSVAGKEIALPFKTEVTWGCDFTIQYEKKKYLLLLDDQNYFRLVYYPSHPKTGIEAYDAPAVRFTKIVLALEAGASAKDKAGDLAALAADERSRGDVRQAVFELIRGEPRTALSAHLALLRKAYVAEYPNTSAYPVLPDTGDPWKFDSVLHAAAVTRDFLHLPRLFKMSGEWEARALQACRLVSGKEFASLDAARDWWRAAVPRARAKGDREKLPPILRRLQEGDLAERDAAAGDILDLGPAVLEALRGHAAHADAEVRSRVADLVAELEVLRDLRADLAR